MSDEHMCAVCLCMFKITENKMAATTPEKILEIFCRRIKKIEKQVIIWDIAAHHNCFFLS